VSETLAADGFDNADVLTELALLNGAKVKSMGLLFKMTPSDWDKVGVSVGAARSLQDAVNAAAAKEASEAVQSSGLKRSMSRSAQKAKNQPL
jgi:hypothetical protein